MKKVISIFELNNRSGIATGFQGKQIYLKLLERIVPHEQPQPLFLNFKDVIATGSFFREAILQLRDYCVARKYNLFPVAANLNDETLNELNCLLELSPDALFICDLDENEIVTSSRVIGILDEKQEITFEALLNEREADAPTLAKKYGSGNEIGNTGWNNRLVALANKGLISERRKGRTKLYSPILEVI